MYTPAERWLTFLLIPQKYFNLTKLKFIKNCNKLREP